MSPKRATQEERIWGLLESVTDPEIPVLSLVDLGVARRVEVSDDGVEVTITPTYSGCPAMDTMEVDIRRTLRDNGYGQVQIKRVLSPAWTTDWLSEAGREKLRAYGIAPPEHTTSDKGALLGRTVTVTCPRCGSRNTELVSQFGSTACKALYKCTECLEPFDYFKCI